jgi:hypothetical protein
MKPGYLAAAVIKKFTAAYRSPEHPIGWFPFTEDLHIPRVGGAYSHQLHGVRNGIGVRPAFQEVARGLGGERGFAHQHCSSPLRVSHFRILLDVATENSDTAPKESSGGRHVEGRDLVVRLTFQAHFFG